MQLYNTLLLTASLSCALTEYDTIVVIITLLFAHEIRNNNVLYR